MQEGCNLESSRTKPPERTTSRAYDIQRTKELPGLIQALTQGRSDLQASDTCDKDNKMAICIRSHSSASMRLATESWPFHSWSGSLQHAKAVAAVGSLAVRHREGCSCQGRSRRMEFCAQCACRQHFPTLDRRQEQLSDHTLPAILNDIPKQLDSTSCKDEEGSHLRNAHSESCCPKRFAHRGAWSLQPPPWLGGWPAELCVQQLGHPMPKYSPATAGNRSRMDRCHKSLAQLQLRRHDGTTSHKGKKSQTSIQLAKKTGPR